MDEKNHLKLILAKQIEISNAMETEREMENMYQQSQSLYEEGMEYKKPSFFKYSVLYGLTVVIELIDLTTFTGFGIPVAMLVSFALSTLMFLIFWFTNTKQKRADEFAEKASAWLQELPKNMAHIERRGVQAARLVRKFKPVRKMAVKSYAALKKSPLSKFAAAAVANLIPLLDVMPWVIVGVWLSYRDEKASYRNANEAAVEGVKGTLAEVEQLAA